MSFIPLSAEAATSKPSCALTVAAGEAEIKISKEGDIIIHEDEEFQIEWNSKNAKDAELNDEEIDLSDSDTFSPTKKSTTYEFVFKNGSRKATCEVTAHIAAGSIDDVTTGTKPMLSGEATGVKKVNVLIYKEGGKKPVFEKKNISVKRGEWKTKVTKTLAKGPYEVRLTGEKNYDLDWIASAMLTVGSKNELSEAVDNKEASSKGTLSVTTLPLLAGGSTRAGTNVPVAYLQLRNTGSEAVHVTGFNVKQNGTASTNVITALSTVDDKGLSRGVSATNPFKNGIAFAPTDSIIEPGALKLFTIKAQLGLNVTAGTNLMLDVVSVGSNGSEKGVFPLRGTTWAIGG